MIKKVDMALKIIFMILINSALGFVGEYFGYPVLDKIGIVFAAVLLSFVEVLVISTLTPLTLSILLADPLVAWKTPSYIIYGLFLYIAFGLLTGKLKGQLPATLFMSTLFLGAGLFLVLTRNLMALLAGLSLIGFGLLLMTTYLKILGIHLELSPKLVGLIALVLAPFLLVSMDLALFSVMFVDVFSPTWFDVVKPTLAILIIDSLGPLILLGILWLALDLSTVLKEINGKIRVKRRIIGLLLLILLVSPVLLAGGYQLLSNENTIKRNITGVLPQDKWFVSSMRMAYIWGPLGASGVTFIGHHIEHTDPNSEWYQAGVNFYLVKSKKLVDMNKREVDFFYIEKLIALEFIAWLRLQQAPAEEPSINIVKAVNLITLNMTYLMFNLTISTVSDVEPHEEITLGASCLVSYVEELGSTVMILVYGEVNNYQIIGQDIFEKLKNFAWI